MWGRLDRTSPYEIERESPGERRKRQLLFHQGEVVAYTSARASAKGEVSKARHSGRPLGCETFRIKSLGTFPEVRMTLRHPLAEVDERTSRYLVATFV